MKLTLGLALAQKRVRGFLHGESGGATVEFIMMVPLFMGLLGLFADASMLYMRQSELMNVARDTARIVSRNAMTATEAVSYATTAASSRNVRASVQVTVNQGFVTVTITANAAALAPMGIVTFAVGDVIRATTTSTMEPI